MNHNIKNQMTNIPLLPNDIFSYILSMNTNSIIEERNRKRHKELLLPGLKKFHNEFNFIFEEDMEQYEFNRQYRDENDIVKFYLDILRCGDYDCFVNSSDEIQFISTDED
jgi:hypothetical protein